MSTPRSAAPNGLGQAFGILADEWTLLILRAAEAGATRYSAFLERLPISHAVLSGRLARLVDENLLERHVYQERPERSEYLLTPKGAGIWPILLTIWNWERRWVTSHRYSTPPLVHLTCGNEMAPQYCCQECGKEARSDNVLLSWGPAGGWSNSAPDTSTRRRAASRRESGAFYPDTMAVFGNRWSALIVAAAFTGVRRFRDFEGSLGLPPVVLAERLAVLCRREIFEQVKLEDRPDWSEYRLTRKGTDLFPVLATIVRWAERWYPPEEGAVIRRTHVDCGAALHGALVCDQCHEVLRGDTIDISAV